MEFPFIATKVLNTNQDGFAILTAKRNLASYPRQRGQSFDANSGGGDPLESIIDRMGLASAKAQKLP